MANVKAKTKTASRRAAAAPRVARATHTNEKQSVGVIGFRAAVRSFFARYFDFNGTSTRAEYWWVMLFMVIIMFGGTTALPVLAAVSHSMLVAWIVLIAMWVLALFGLVLVVPSMALMARRVHDAGFSAWVFFIPWGGVTLIGWVAPYIRLFPTGLLTTFGFAVGVWGLMLALLPSKVKGNPYRD